MISDYLPQFLPQCCDAVFYLLKGEACATTNACYDTLRPIGAQLWFSLPYRLGLPVESLIVVHWLLLFISIALSVKALAALSKTTPTLPTKVILLFCSTIIHLVFCWPVMSLALTDAPAALFVLIATWLLCLDNTTSHPLRLALAGLLLGCSAWIRFAYCYPLLGALAIFILLWLLDTQRQKMELLLLTALIPIVIQFGASYFHYHTFGFLGPQSTRGLAAEHFHSTAAGQETILPQQQYLWPTTCERKIGIEQALHEKDFATVSCLTANRFYFSFGSYSPDTYMFAATNLLTHSAVEHVGLISRWHYWNADGIQRVVTAENISAPDGSNRVINEKLVVTDTAESSGHTIYAGKRLPVGEPYTFSVWLWSPQERTIDLALRLPNEQRELARQSVTLTAQPSHFSVTGTVPQSSSWFASRYADIEVVIDAPLSQVNSVASPTPAEFYAWGAQLEQSSVMTDYQGANDNDVTRTDFRYWSPLLLAANLIAIASVLLWFIIFRAHITRLHILPAMLMLLIVGEIIVTQPEQRFVIAVEVYIWMYVVLWCCHWYNRLSPPMK